MGSLAPVVLVVGLVGAACSNGGNDEGRELQVRLTGRVFAAENGKALVGAAVLGPGGGKVRATKAGVFEVKYPGKAGGSVVATAPKAAPVRKLVPEGGGYIELYVKGYDAEQDIEPEKGGAVVAPDGGKLEVKGGKLERAGGGRPKHARLSLASIQPGRASALSALPGNFDAEKNGHVGKLSVKSSLYVSAREGEQELALARGVKATLELAAPDTKQQKASRAPRSLYRYDENQDRWVEGGHVEEVTDAAGDLVYRGAVDTFGWWMVGDFRASTCVRGCVEGLNGEAAPFARIVASGIDHATQLSTYAGEDGCYALDVPANARISLAAQAEEAFAGPLVLTTRKQQLSAAQEPSRCEPLADLVLERVRSKSCPLGFEECADACVDTSLDADHCGGCDRRCDGVCADARCTGQERHDTDAGQDAGPQGPSLSVSKSGDGTGTIVSAPAGIDCGEQCSALFPYDTSVELVASADDNSSTFSGWSGDCANADGPACTLTMDRARSAEASFLLRSHLLTVTNQGDGSGSVVGQVVGDASQTNIVNCGGRSIDCDETLLHGTMVTLEAAPSNYVALAWGGACAGAQGNTCTVSITNATNVTVTFSRILYTLTVRARDTGTPPAGSGTLTSVPAGIACTNSYMLEVVCTYQYFGGVSVDLTAVVAGSDSFFAGWSGDCASAGTDTTCSLVMDGNKDASGTFGGVIL